MKTFDVLVIGSGPVGLLSAHVFAKHFNNVGIITPIATTTHDYYDRALGLSYGSLRRLADFDIDLNRGAVINRVEFRHQHQISSILEAEKLRVPILGKNIMISDLINLLESQIESNVSKIVGRVVRIQDYLGGWKIFLVSGEEIFTRYLIGADGINSMVRKELDFEFENYHDFKQSAWVLTMNHSSKKIPTTAYQIGAEELLIGLLPLSETQSSLVITGATHHVTEKQQESLNEFIKYLQRILPNDYCIDNLSFREEALVDLKTFHVKNQAGPNYLLIGLAAKSFHPAAAMGFNQTIYELALINQFLSRPGRKKDFSWAQNFTNLTSYRCQMIRAVTATLASRWSRELLNYLTFPIKKMTNQFAELLA